MRIALMYSHHRRCGPWYYKRACVQLGHEVVSVGPWSNESYGTHGREPDVYLSREIPLHYEWAEVVAKLPWAPDVFLLVEGGEDLRCVGIPAGQRWAHISTEGVNLTWHSAAPKFAEIMCNGAAKLSDVTWLPKAFDIYESAHAPQTHREYDLVQIASMRDSRLRFWDRVNREAMDLHTIFGDMWGPLYNHAYKNSLSTYTCSTLDFVTTRVFEAMSMGCVVIADRTPSMLSLFEDGVDFIGYTPEIGPDREGTPPFQWFVETVRKLRRDGDGGMASRAMEKVWARHSYRDRIETVLASIS